ELGRGHAWRASLAGKHRCWPSHRRHPARRAVRHARGDQRSGNIYSLLTMARYERCSHAPPRRARFPQIPDWKGFSMDASSQEIINRMITGYWSTQAVYVAAKLGIADLLVEGPRSVDDLAKAVK